MNPLRVPAVSRLVVVLVAIVVAGVLNQITSARYCELLTASASLLVAAILGAASVVGAKGASRFARWTGVGLVICALGMLPNPVVRAVDAFKEERAERLAIACPREQRRVDLAAGIVEMCGVVYSVRRWEPVSRAEGYDVVREGKHVGGIFIGKQGPAGYPPCVAEAWFGAVGGGKPVP